MLDSGSTGAAEDDLSQRFDIGTIDPPIAIEIPCGLLAGIGRITSVIHDVTQPEQIDQIDPPIGAEIPAQGPWSRDGREGSRRNARRRGEGR